MALVSNCESLVNETGVRLRGVINVAHISRQCITIAKEYIKFFNSKTCRSLSKLVGTRSRMAFQQVGSGEDICYCDPKLLYVPMPSVSMCWFVFLTLTLQSH